MCIIFAEGGDDRRELELEISESDRFRLRAIVVGCAWAIENVVGWKLDWNDVARIPIFDVETLG
jgi:hypothetical protein